MTEPTGPQQWNATPPSPRPSKAGWWKRTWFVATAVGVIALIVGAAIGGSSSKTKTVVKNVSGPIRTVVSVSPSPVYQTVQVPGPTRIVTKTVHVTQTVPAPTTTEPPTTPAPKTSSNATGGILLKVTGNGSSSSDITYSYGTSIEQATGASIPWTKQGQQDGDLIQLDAQDGDGGTSITCEIYGPDGNILDKETSTGQYAIASCQTEG